MLKKRQINGLIFINIMLVNKENILKYIPQRAPFVMIDALIEANETSFESSFLIEQDNLFLADKCLSESALIENIAQTCAAGFGYVATQNGEDAGGMGFIGAISKLEVLGTAEVGNLIQTSIKVLSSFGTIHLIEGVARCNETDLLTCQLKIVLA